MTNTELLEEKIRLSGKKKSYLAKKIGLSRQGFRNCRLNTAEFTTTQVQILCEELNIDTLEERHEIFFAQDVA